MRRNEEKSGTDFWPEWFAVSLAQMSTGLLSRSIAKRQRLVDSGVIRCPPPGDKLCLVCNETPGPLILGQVGGPRYRV